MIISQSDVICQDNRDAHFSENINFTKKIVFFVFQTSEMWNICLDGVYFANDNKVENSHLLVNKKRT